METSRTIPTPQTVVILGAGWVGLPIAHKLLKYTLPKAHAGLKVILVSPNSHFYWNIAAVRGIIPGAIPDDKLFIPIEPGFAQYSAKNFQFVLGKAESINMENNTVRVAKNDGSPSELFYDQLVIATGSYVRSKLPFKSVGTHEQTLAALHALQKQVEAAKSIVVAGSGPSGVETAGELAAAYGGKKEIIFIMKGECALQDSHVLPSVSKVIENDLKKLGVKLVRNTRVEEEEKLQTNGEDGPVGKQITLTLSDGFTLNTDLYLPLFGAQLNTAFVPSSLLDPLGNLALDQKMRVVSTSNIWGIGDVGNLEAKQITNTDAQIIHLAAALDCVLMGEEGEVKDYKPSTKIMMFITMGKKYATGQIGGWKLWGWMVSWPKGRALFLDTAPGYVNGKQLRHASM